MTSTVAGRCGWVDVNEVRAFGTAIKSGRLPPIAGSGLIVLADQKPLDHNGQGKEDCDHADRQGEGSEEARPSARSRARPSGQAAAPGSPAHALGDRVSRELQLDELSESYADVSVFGSSSSAVWVRVPILVFNTLREPVYLSLEVPREPTPRTWRYSALVPRQAVTHVFVPDVRAWAATGSGFRIRSHHEYSDGSICAYMQGEWVWGVHPLLELVDWYSYWVAKSIHLQLFDEWPGPQHCPALMHLRRNAVNECCHCGASTLWASCHRPSDLMRDPYDIVMEAEHARVAYLRELFLQGRPPRFNARSTIS